MVKLPEIPDEVPRPESVDVGVLMGIVELLIGAVPTEVMNVERSLVGYPR